MGASKTVVLAMTSLLALASPILISSPAIAQTAGKGATPMAAQGPSKAEMEQASETALRQTQQLLRSRSEREKALQADGGRGAANDQSARKAIGDAATEKSYELSAQIIETIVRRANGDPVKMQQMMNELTANPHSLEQYLSASQREDIRQLASDIEKKQGLQPAPAGK